MVYAVCITLCPLFPLLVTPERNTKKKWGEKRKFCILLLGYERILKRINYVVVKGLHLNKTAGNQFLALFRDLQNATEIDWENNAECLSRILLEG